MVGLAPLEPRDQSLSAMGLVVTRITGVAKNRCMPSPPAAPAVRFEFGKPSTFHPVRAFCANYIGCLEFLYIRAQETASFEARILDLKESVVPA